MKASDQQIGGGHYKDMPIQPVEFIERNGLGFCAGNVVKYVCRYKAKGGAEDIRKAIHYCQLLLEYADEPGNESELEFAHDWARVDQTLREDALQRKVSEKLADTEGAIRDAENHVLDRQRGRTEGSERTLPGADEKELGAGDLAVAEEMRQLALYRKAADELIAEENPSGNDPKFWYRGWVAGSLSIRAIRKRELREGE